MNVQFNQLKKRSLLLILAGLTITLGLVVKFAIMGNPLQAKEEKSLVEVFNGETLLSKDTQVSDDPATVVVKSKENRLLVLPPAEGYDLHVLKDGKEQEITTLKAEDFHQQDTLDLLGIGQESESKETAATTASGTSETASTEAKKETTSDVFAVQTEADPAKANVYVQLVKDQEVTLVFRNVHTNVTVTATDVPSGDYQSLFQLMEQPKEKATDAAVTETTASSETASSTTEAPEKKETALSGTPKKGEETYENIIVAETEKTKKSLKELIGQDYAPEDSLKTPKQFEELTKEASPVPAASSPVIISDAKMSVQTGAATFDSDDVPGHDSNGTNDLVRSFDQVFYKVAFSIQNTSLDTKYTDIRYRVVSELPNAVTVVDGVPTPIAAIANGAYQDLGGGAQSSTGVLESTISDTGSVFVPVVMNVFGAKNGTQLQPTLKLEIVDAVNKETGQTEAINEVYDSSALPALNVPVTKVSSKPSIGVTLNQGPNIGASSVFGSTENSRVQGYDVGAVVNLSPLAGRASGDFRGATFPSGPITYQIKQKGTYQGASTNGAQNLPTSQYDPFTVQASAVALKDRSSAVWQKTGTVNVEAFETPLGTPHGKTLDIYTSQPTGDVSKIGVYDSGSVLTTNGSYSTDVKVDNYVGVINPYTYTMRGGRAPSPLDKGFVSNEFIFRWDSNKSHKLALQNNWSRTDIDLYVDQVSYDGITTANNSSIRITDLIVPTGGWSGWTSFAKPKNGPDPHVANGSIGGVEFYDPYRYAGATWDSLEPGATEWWRNAGNDRLNMGDEVYAFKRVNFNEASVYVPSDGNFLSEGMVMWDYSSLQYDQSRPPYLYSTRGIGPQTIQFKYGVAKNFNNTPPVTLQVGTYANTYALYDWYDTPEQATQTGKPISAMAAKGKTNLAVQNDNEYQLFFGAPLNVIQPTPGDVTPLGNKLTLMSQQRITKPDGTVIHDPMIQSPSSTDPMVNHGKFIPTIFDNNGNPVSYPTVFPNVIGESAWVKGFNITTKTDVEKSLYNSDESIKVKVTGLLNGTSSASYDSALNTTLPKGITYTPGTAKDAEGNPLPDPTITTNSDGTTTLRWVFPNSSLENGVEVNFEATSDFTKIPFNSGGLSGTLVVKTVGEMWTSGNPNVKDTSKEVDRSSQDTFILQLIQQIVLSKQADKTAIEVGENDPLGGDTSITYTVRIANGSADALPKVKWLDVLPYNGDSRGSTIHGGYTVESVSVEDPDDPSQAADATISYTNNATNENTNPNTISGWSTYTPGTSTDAIKDAKAFLVSTDSFPSGKVLELTVKIRPKGQKPGDVYVNNSSMNSAVDLLVHSQVARTKVYGRAISGFVWEDKNVDGLFNIGEPRVADIPVKLYRTSLENPDELSNQLVEEDLQGNKFIDANGNSLVKSDADGNYHFDNLPEGTYVVEFQIHDQVQRHEFKVTTPQVGTDEKINSKADETTYRTPDSGYSGPTLPDLPGAITSNDSIYHMDYLNLGIVRTLGEIYLYKYEQGTAVDKDGNGDPDLTEDNQLVDGTHALAGAEFELREKDSGEVVQKVVTDENGRIHFDKVPFGDYLLVETKAPEGYELIKKPIEVTIDADNQVKYLFVPNALTTELPFTGSTDIMQGVLILSATLSLLGLIGFGIKYQWDEIKRKKAGGR